jgi:hypothetical protein
MEYGLGADIADLVHEQEPKPEKKFNDAASGLLSPYITIETTVDRKKALFISTIYNNNEYKEETGPCTTIVEFHSKPPETCTVYVTQYVKPTPIFTKETLIPTPINAKDLRALLATVHLAVYEEALKYYKIKKK